MREDFISFWRYAFYFEEANYIVTKLFIFRSFFVESLKEGWWDHIAGLSLYCSWS